MRANIFIICLLAAVLAFAFCASPSLAKTGTIDLVRGQTIYGTGESLPGVNVTIEDGLHRTVATAISDSTGNFSIANVSDGGTGRIRVLVTYTENGTKHNATKVSPAWYPSNLSVVDISPFDTSIAIYQPVQTGTSTKPFTALGQVTDARGNGVAGANVTLFDGNYQVIGTSTTNQDGNFGFTNVVASIPGCKVRVVYNTTDGKRYETNMGTALWYFTDSGLVKFSPQETQLTDYPEPGNTGYVWGEITDASGNPLSGTVYLTNDTANLSIQTYDSADAPGFVSEVLAGNYTAYAEHVDANGSLKSKPVSIEVQPALKYLDTNAVIFVADQATPSVNVTPTAAPSASQPAPFVNPALLVIAMIVAVFAAGATDFLKRKK